MAIVNYSQVKIKMTYLNLHVLFFEQPLCFWCDLLLEIFDSACLQERTTELFVCFFFQAIKLNPTDAETYYQRAAMFQMVISNLFNFILTFEFVDDILRCGHSDASYRAMLSCGTIYSTLLGGSNF